MQGKNNKIYVTYNGRKKRLKRKLDGLMFQFMVLITI